MVSRQELIDRLVLATGGLVGAIGVMSAAAASHGGESRNLAAIAAICLAHGPTLLALGLAGRRGMLSVAALLIASGTLVFAGDLGLREWLGHGAFPGAAPLGGVAMIGGWLTLVVAAVVDNR